MPRFMLVCFGDGEPWVRFFDSINAAEAYRTSVVDPLGYYMQIYEWIQNANCFHQYVLKSL